MGMLADGRGFGSGHCTLFLFLFKAQSLLSGGSVSESLLHPAKLHSLVNVSELQSILCKIGTISRTILKSCSEGRLGDTHEACRTV
jgi:hypothetical protein